MQFITHPFQVPVTQTTKLSGYIIILVSYYYHRYETYTVDATDYGDRYTDYTGYSVTSDKPISVSAGHGNVMVLYVYK